MYHRSARARELAERAPARHAVTVTDKSKPEVRIDLAATVIILRTARERLEVLLMRRSSKLAFHGGAWVFPGGKVDAADAQAASDPDDGLSTARHAAVRETQEEAGLTVDAARLVVVSHWTTPLGRPRRFSTWFFAVDVESAAEVVVDGGEIREHRWMRPADALAARARGELELPAPTFVTLSLLQDFASAEDALAYYRAHEPPTYLPKLHLHPDGELTLYHGDAAYEEGDLERVGPRHRLHMLRSGWRYERSG